MLIKASRITNLTDARYFAAKEVDFLGFNLEEGTDGYLDPMYMKAIREWVEGPKIVGEFSRAPVSDIKEAATFFGLDAVQLTAEYTAQLADLEGLEVILEIEVNEQLTTDNGQRIFREAAPFVTCFLLKFPPVASILQQAEFWQKLFEQHPVLLQADLAAEQLSAILETLKAVGLSLTGGGEEQVGVKSFDEIETIFETLGR